MARGRVTFATAAAVLLAMLTATQCGGGSSTRPTPPGGTEPPPGTIPPGPGPGPIPSAPQTFVGAGDIAWCGLGADRTAAIIQSTPGQVFTAGDNAYMDGSLKNYMDCYEPTWGRFRDRTRPVAGNHEYDTDRSAGGYYSYFGTLASRVTDGYYSYEVGDWHIIALNSALPNNGFSGGSAQLAWLEQDLATHRTKCTAAIWHHPLFTSGPNGPNVYTRAAWRVLYEANVDVIINGHDHLYERFAPQDPDGRPDPVRGMRQFTVGTGGALLYNVQTVQPNSDVRISQYGVLKFTLMSSSYDWQFLPVSGAGDSGHGECH